jgi:pimeloyl-ACP methyl ester carboxylesterase
MTEQNDHCIPKPVQAALASGSTDRILEAVGNLSAEDAGLLESVLGRDAVKGMQRKARRGRARAVGRVVVTHGITGSELASVDSSGDRDKIWVNLWRLFGGRIAELKMDAEGRSRRPVRIDGIRVEYMPLIVELSSRWDVLPFAYDWRENIDQSAARLDAAIADWAKGQPAHIVAHSMGGLVARRFIQHFGQRWDSMNDANGQRAGGRLVMLGTPNHGSFAVTLMLSGAEKLLKWLEILDRRHNMKELLKIIDSFHGSYQMLPSPLLAFGDDRLKLAAKEEWGRLPVTQALLDLGFDFQRQVARVVDPGRMIYVAGYDRKTPFRIRIDAAGQFSYQHTMDGDGRVPHELGLLEGVPTYWLNETHGDLPRNARLHSGIHQLLESGRTDELESRRPRSRAVFEAEPVWQKGEDVYAISEQERTALESIAGSRRGGKPAEAGRDSAVLGSAMLEDYLGGSPSASRGTRGKPAAAAGRTRARPRGAPRTLRVEVHCGDITRAHADVYAVGHYIGVEPQYAELALDCAVSGIKRSDVTESSRLVITQLTRRGVIKGELGEVHFYPFAGDRERKRLAAIAGMGLMGTFGRRQLVRLAESLASATASLPDAQTLCMVVIGTGAGGLRTAVAVEAILEGVLKAVDDGDRGAGIKTLKFCELHLGKALELQDELQRCKPVLEERYGGVQLDIGRRPRRGAGARLGSDYALALALSGLSLATSKRSRAEDRRAVTAIVESLGLPGPFKTQITEEIARLSEGAGEGTGRIELSRLARRLGLNLRRAGSTQRDIPTRLSVSWDGSNVVVAALTDVAVVPERASGVQKSLVDEAIRRMVDPASEAVQDLGRRMNGLLLPRDFRDIVRETNGPVVFEVDREMAKVHWEMVAQDATRGADAKALGLTVQVARQLRTAYSTVPASELPQTDTLRALVIGDPGDPDLGHDLPGARREAMEVAGFLDSCGVEVTLMIGAPGSPPERFKGGTVPNASMFDVLSELMDGGYDILHYAGHGNFDSREPTARSGWQFKGGLLTARELERVDLAPRLVVANACLSGLTSDRTWAEARTGRLDADLLPGLADEFFRRGVRNYVGTAWEVDDLGAIAFARALYEALLKGDGTGDRTLGAAMLAARKTLARQQSRFDALWAAYQHYGSPGFTLTGPSSATSRLTARRARPLAMDEEGEVETAPSISRAPPRPTRKRRPRKRARRSKG